MKVAVTGASGFIGRSLSGELTKRGFKVKKIVRCKKSTDSKTIEIKDFLYEKQWENQFKDVSCVIHCAGIAHELSKRHKSSEEEYNSLNVKLPTIIMKKAILQGVKKFIFISTSKVHGEKSPSYSFNVNHALNPEGMYATSKLQAEKELSKLAKDNDIKLVIIRPALVYGPGVKANFRNLIKFILSGFPIPLGKIENQRSFVFIDNLNDLIINCIQNEKANNEVFLVSDGQDISIRDLTYKISNIGNNRALVIRFPQLFLKIILNLIGKKKVAETLFNEFRLDITHTKNQLGWFPKYTMDQGLEQTVNHFLETPRS